jgi:NADH-ubiquinone oxidoreductase chain 4
LLFFYIYNFFYFYVFFELSLVPILILILSCGNQIEKINSSYYLIFYSILTTFPFLFVYFNFDVFLFIIYLDFIFNWEFVFFLILGFIIKFPIYVLHFWLPKAHVESPSSGSILLAGLLLKFGTIGFIRFLGCIYFLNLYI